MPHVKVTWIQSEKHQICAFSLPLNFFFLNQVCEIKEKTFGGIWDPSGWECEHFMILPGNGTMHWWTAKACTNPAYQISQTHGTWNQCTICTTQRVLHECEWVTLFIWKGLHEKRKRLSRQRLNHAIDSWKGINLKYLLQLSRWRGNYTRGGVCLGPPPPTSGP